MSSTSIFASHSHVASNWTSYSSGLRPRRAQFNFLLATEAQINLPANAMIFSQETLDNTTEFTDSNTTYISSGGTSITNGSINAGPTSDLQASVSGSAGSHLHWGLTGRTFASGTGSTGRDIFSAGAHSHAATLTMFQPTFGPTVILRLFRILSELPPTRDIIVGYVGNANAIPFPWFPCNGQNGTINLTEKFIAINSTISAGTNLAGPTWEALNRTTSTSSQNKAHSHGGTSRWFSGGLSYGHLTGNWAHNHGNITYNFDGTAITAPKVSIQFIQYKG
jgi:hypothetical protein